MHRLDFLSGAPKTFIFEKSSNKTNLGGVFTLIYLIIVLIISLAYIVDYEVNPKYEAQFSSEHFFNYDNEYRENKMKDKKFNPKLSFRFEYLHEELENNFIIYNSSDMNPLEFRKEYESFSNEFSFYLGYICKNTSCLLPQDENHILINIYTFVLFYSGYEINHQNETSPLEPKEIPIIYHVSPFEDKYTLFYNHWKNIIYKEEKGLLGTFENLLGNDNDYYGGEYINSLIYTPDKPEELKEEEKSNNIKLLAHIYTNSLEIEHYIDNYSRTKKSIWTTFANICSLSLTIYNGFIFVFYWIYSKNFDSYKIIEKILSKSNNKNINNNKMDNKKNINFNDNIMIELSDDFDKKNNLIEKDNNDSNNKESNDNKINKEKDDSDKFENNNDDNNNRYLPKLHFYDYFINNIYMKKCCSSNKQDIISACNEIILKLYSVDHILHNIIILENLFKDYKWNDPNLNGIESNEMIKNLKSLI